MQILFYSYNFTPKDRGGMEKFFLSIIQKLKKQHQIVLLLPNWHNISLNGVKIYHIPEFKFEFKIDNLNNIKSSILGFLKIISSLIATILFLPFILFRNKIDIVNIFQPSHSTPLICLISRLLRKKTIISLRGLDWYVHPLIQITKDLSFIFTNNILTNSKDLFDCYKRTSILPQFLFLNKRIYTIPNGIDTNFWKPNKEQIKEKKNDLVFVGHLYDKSHIFNKGIGNLSKALKIIREKHNKKLKTIIIGEYDLKLLKEMINSDIDKYFNFKGFLHSKTLIKNELQNSKIFVLSSNSEGLPNCLMEAMALEMPCIASNVGSISTLIDNNKNGLIFELKKPNELPNLILYLLKNNNLQKKLGKNARKKMINQFNWDIVIKKYNILFKKLIK